MHGQFDSPSSVGESLSGDTGSSKRAKNFLSFFQSNRPKKTPPKNKRYTSKNVRYSEVKTLLVIIDSHIWFPGGTARLMCHWGNSTRENLPQVLTVPLGLRGHWLVLSVATPTAELFEDAKAKPQCMCADHLKGTHLSTFSLTLRGAASQALTASSRVIPRVHLPQMYRILSLGWTLPSSLAGEPGTTSRQ